MSDESDLDQIDQNTLENFTPDNKLEEILALNMNRRQAITTILGTAGGIAVWALAPSISGEAATVPQPTPTPKPVETIDEIAKTQELVANINQNMNAIRCSLVLPQITNQESEETETDWETTRNSLNYWGINQYLGEAGVPAPASARHTDVDIALIIGAKDAPMPIGLYNNISNTSFGWELLAENEENTYYAATINGERHPYAHYALDQFEPSIASETSQKPAPLIIENAQEGYTFETASLDGYGYEKYNQVQSSSLIERTTADFELIQGHELNSLFTQIAEQNPELTMKIVIAASDGFFSPTAIDPSANQRTINPQDPKLPYSPTYPSHNLLTQSIVRKFLGPKANVEVVGSKKTNEDFWLGIGSIIDDRLQMLERGEALPITIFNHPYHLYFGLSKIPVSNREYSWSDEELLIYLHDLNIIVVGSLGNTPHMFDTRDDGINLSSEEITKLIKSTHIAVTKGAVSGGDLYIDPQKGIPHPDDPLLNDITYISPGFFPALGFVSALSLNPENKFPVIAPALSGFEHHPILIDQYGSGSSFAVTALATQIAFFALASQVGENRGFSASEILAKFNSHMQHRKVPYYENEATSRDLRTVNTDYLINLGNSIVNHNQQETRLPGIYNN